MGSRSMKALTEESCLSAYFCRRVDAAPPDAPFDCGVNAIAVTLSIDYNINRLNRVVNDYIVDHIAGIDVEID